MLPYGEYLFCVQSVLRIRNQFLPAVQDLFEHEEHKGLTIDKKVFYLSQKVTEDDLINDVRVKNVSVIAGIYRVEV